LISSVIGFGAGGYAASIYICPHCQGPTAWYDRIRIPGASSARHVDGLPGDIEILYKEIRGISSTAPTSAVLACRKLLMNIAVSQGAKEGLSFVDYVTYLADKGFVPPNGKGWVDHIRKKGNEANHEIKLMDTAEAEELVAFAEMLMKFVFEFPNKIPKTKP
jgi:hypothetical protein